MTVVLQNTVERTRFLKFLVVGIIGAVVDFGVMNLLTTLFSTPLVIAGTISFICAVCSNFVWNRYWTYPDSRSRPLMKQMAMFFIVNIAGVAIRIPILHFLEPVFLAFTSRLPIPSPISAEVLAKNLTLAVAVFVVLLWNFFINRYWTYNDIN
jgi:putative flippase GtrA